MLTLQNNNKLSRLILRYYVGYMYIGATTNQIHELNINITKYGTIHTLSCVNQIGRILRYHPPLCRHLSICTQSSCCPEVNEGG